MKSLEEEKIAKALGAYICEARKNKGLKQKEVAKEVGICRSYYAFIENGKRDAHFSIALNIFRVLGLSVHDFQALLK